MRQALYDLHIHSEFSHDSQQTVPALCETALALGLGGVAVTDHGDCPVAEERHNRETISASAQAAAAAAQHYAGRLEVLCGVEIGEECWAPQQAAMLHSLADFDVILASVHGLYRNGEIAYYSREIFDAAHYTDDALQDFLRRYLYGVAENAEVADYDVLAHLDCPLRYTNAKFGRGATLDAHADLIDEILRTLIRRGKILEVNTSGIARGWGRLMPSVDILTRYRELGGRMVCLGSDAHKGADMAAGFAQTAQLLAQMGFPGQTTCRRRQPCLLPWDAPAGQEGAAAPCESR